MPDTLCPHRFLADAGARELFSAASAYARAGDPNRARAARAACLCLLALREPAEAQRYITLADELEAGEGGAGGAPPHASVQTKFLQLKYAGAHAAAQRVCVDTLPFKRRVCLERGVEEESALAALRSFTRCPDFDVDFLYLAALVRWQR